MCSFAVLCWFVWCAPVFCLRVLAFSPLLCDPPRERGPVGAGAVLCARVRSRCVVSSSAVSLCLRLFVATCHCGLLSLLRFCTRRGACARFMRSLWLVRLPWRTLESTCRTDTTTRTAPCTRTRRSSSRSSLGSLRNAGCSTTSARTGCKPPRLAASSRVTEAVVSGVPGMGRQEESRAKSLMFITSITVPHSP